MRVGAPSRQLCSAWARDLVSQTRRGDVSGPQTLSTKIRTCTTGEEALTKHKPSPPSTTLTAAEFAHIAPMVLLRQALQQRAVSACGVGVNENANVISRAVFDQYCAEIHIENSEEALRLLAEAGTVVPISDGEGVHLRPLQLVHMHEDLVGAGVATGPSSLFFIEEATRRLEAAQAEEAAMRQELQPAVMRAARWRRRVWGAALCFAGAQLAIISRLTFFDLDWDIMEPVSYFLGTGTSLFFFGYFLRYGRSHTYRDYDQTMLPKKLKQYAPRDFDWDKYKTFCNKVDAERSTLEKIKAWMKQH
ncbi:putative calcium uniporter protein, mitochondrial [Trypanosoma rangeli]|uniref:Putative calcium uniporter protein, mitochondrial n=1 Tax=Trypanosoma rangeli TaxID=5698 RepID=A0A422NMN9_TRYRA|nr:putative calcium uniporter protein, mitochondrial [Trypanosoma rangeli]RNF06770.1 putative calcium uniporter protein, mitochondrial [Trypanosoma rangeli]|eukprot:RNF06770.1 putative calcium uniporter protein, mitochondrial [Trypanosoma rangeli]